jgi:tetratricopeptide (TPR) repeat protein
MKTYKTCLTLLLCCATLLQVVSSSVGAETVQRTNAPNCESPIETQMIPSKQEIQQAIDQYTQAVVLSPHGFYCRGLNYYLLSFHEQREESLTKAYDDLTKAISFNANSDLAFYYRGLVSIERTGVNSEQAIADIKKSIELNPERWLSLLRQQNRPSIADFERKLREEEAKCKKGNSRGINKLISNLELDLRNPQLRKERAKKQELLSKAKTIRNNFCPKS